MVLLENRLLLSSVWRGGNWWGMVGWSSLRGRRLFSRWRRLLHMIILSSFMDILKTRGKNILRLRRSTGETWKRYWRRMILPFGWQLTTSENCKPRDCSSRQSEQSQNSIAIRSPTGIYIRKISSAVSSPRPWSCQTSAPRNGSRKIWRTPRS
jgi:hypothetical protein